MTVRLAHIWWPLAAAPICSALNGCLTYDRDLLDSATGGEPDASEEPQGTGGGGVAGDGDTGPAAGGTDAGPVPECPWDSMAPLLQLEPTDLLDDFNDGDNQIPEVKGRDGAWFSLNDGSGGSQEPSAGNWVGLVMPSTFYDPADRALHYSGHSFIGSGRGDGWHLFGTDFAAGEPYDLSAYDGVALWVRADCATPGNEQQRLRIAISDSSSEGSAGRVDHPGITLDFDLSHEWRQVKLAFDSFARRFGAGGAFDRSSSRALYLSPANEGALDVWVDEVVFYADE